MGRPKAPAPPTPRADGHTPTCRSQRHRRRRTPPVQNRWRFEQSAEGDLGAYQPLERGARRYCPGRFGVAESLCVDAQMLVEHGFEKRCVNRESAEGRGYRAAPSERAPANRYHAAPPSSPAARSAPPGSGHRLRVRSSNANAWVEEGCAPPIAVNRSSARAWRLECRASNADEDWADHGDVVSTLARRYAALGGPSLTKSMEAA